MAPQSDWRGPDSRWRRGRTEHPRCQSNRPCGIFPVSFLCRNRWLVIRAPSRRLVRQNSRLDRIMVLAQPLSVAGQRKGHADERHLWPAFYSLIAECSPPIVFGEQVASRDGREWLAGVRADLEGVGYACGAADLCAAGLGRPQIRQRLYWVADSSEFRPRSEESRNRATQANGRPTNDSPPDRRFIDRFGNAHWIPESDAFLSWLMGFPQSWIESAPSVMRSSRKLPRNS